MSTVCVCLHMCVTSPPEEMMSLLWRGTEQRLKRKDENKRRDEGAKMEERKRGREIDKEEGRDVERETKWVG